MNQRGMTVHEEIIYCQRCLNKWERGAVLQPKDPVIQVTIKNFRRLMDMLQREVAA